MVRCMTGPAELAERLAAAARERIESGTFGIVGGIVAGDEEMHFFEAPPESVHSGTVDEAWAQVQVWVTEEDARAGGLALNVDLLEPSGTESSYEVIVEGQTESINFLHPYRRRRVRGWDFSAGRIYTEANQKRLDI
jgi:hypothetical protein